MSQNTPALVDTRSRSQRVKDFFLKWYRFFRPAENWLNEYKKVKAGQYGWPNPYSRDGSGVMPWPITWLPHRELNDSDVSVELLQALGLGDQRQEGSIGEIVDRLEREQSPLANPARRFVRGFEFIDVVCVDTGLVGGVGVGMYCCRCRVPLHPIAAYPALGEPSFQPPYCKRCAWLMVFYK